MRSVPINASASGHSRPLPSAVATRAPWTCRSRDNAVAPTACATSAHARSSCRASADDPEAGVSVGANEIKPRVVERWREFLAGPGGPSHPVFAPWHVLAKLAPKQVDYVATTGEGENVKFATGHFYSMTTHARGGVFLEPEARAVVTSAR